MIFKVKLKFYTVTCTACYHMEAEEDTKVYTHRGRHTPFHMHQISLEIFNNGSSHLSVVGAREGSGLGTGEGKGLCSAQQFPPFLSGVYSKIETQTNKLHLQALTLEKGERGPCHVQTLISPSQLHQQGGGGRGQCSDTWAWPLLQIQDWAHLHWAPQHPITLKT